MTETSNNVSAELKDKVQVSEEKIEPTKSIDSKTQETKETKDIEKKDIEPKKDPEETEEAGFEIISKEAENVKNTIEEALKKDAIEESKNEGPPKEAARKKSVVDIALIKESEVQSESLEETLKNMPGMTTSKSKEILKISDEKELKQIAKDLVSNNEDEEEDDGSVIDIAVVNESDTDKEVDEVQQDVPVSGFQAEIIDDDTEVTIVPAEDEQVVEFTLEMRHLLLIASALIGLIAVFYAAIFYQNNIQ